VLFLSGDDGAAKAEVAELFEAAGFFPVDLGDLDTGDACSRPEAARFQASTWCGCRERLLS
jgi:8-hydroxy-5-deazaflavin:NADPH oxidoreductase